MAPLRSWKELFLGERALKSKRAARRRFTRHTFTAITDHSVVGN